MNKVCIVWDRLEGEIVGIFGSEGSARKCIDDRVAGANSDGDEDQFDAEDLELDTEWHEVLP